MVVGMIILSGTYLSIETMLFFSINLMCTIKHSTRSSSH